MNNSIKFMQWAYFYLLNDLVVYFKMKSKARMNRFFHNDISQSSDFKISDVDLLTISCLLRKHILKSDKISIMSILFR